LELLDTASHLLPLLGDVIYRFPSLGELIDRLGGRFVVLVAVIIHQLATASA
jgi:hypothetical protein